MKNHYKIINLPDPINIGETCSKNYVDNIFKNDIDFNDVKLENNKFVKVNYQPAHPNHLTPKIYVDSSIDEISLVRHNKDNDFSNYKLTNINSITLNKQAENDDEVITKAYVDQFHQENERSRRHLGIVFYNESSDLVKNNQDNNFNDNKLTNINSITINNNPSDANHVSNKNYIVEELDKNTIVRLNDDSNDRYLQVHINNTAYNLQIYKKTQIIDTTKLIFPNTGTDLLQDWKIICNNRLDEGIPSDFLKRTKTHSPTYQSGTTSLAPIGTCFMYIETSANNHNSTNDNVFVSFERTDYIHISNITFYYNRFSTSIADKRIWVN